MLLKSFYHSFVLQLTFMHSTTTLRAESPSIFLKEDRRVLYNRLKANTLARFRKTMKPHGISRTQCRTLFVISKATFTKTAIKPKFVDRFSLKNSRAAIDRCTIKSLNFVSIENFWSCLTSAQIGWKLIWDLAKFLLWDFLLPRVKHNIKYLCSTREFTALACPL